MATTNKPTQLLSEIQMNDRSDSTDITMRNHQYWANQPNLQNQSQPSKQLTFQKTFNCLIFIMVAAILVLVIYLVVQHERSSNTCHHWEPTHTACHYDPSSFISSINEDSTNTMHIENRINRIQIAERPKNLIVMIGDGMGTIYNSAYRLYKNKDRTILDSIFKGRYSTNPFNNTITDSAAGATAFSVGKKTFNGNIAVDVSGNPLGTILEALKRKGLGTGLIATKSITDATPASFASHALNRHFGPLIAKQLVALHQHYPWTNCTITDILMGGGKMFFDAWGFNESSYDQYGWNKYLTDNATLYELCTDDLPVVGLFADEYFPFYLDRSNTEKESGYPSLLDMTKVSMHLLNASYYDKGFFMMIEGSQIDVCGHINDVACMMNEMEQFYETVEYVSNWAKEDGDTLVVVLADHQTGGFSIGRQDAVMKDKLVNGRMQRLYGFTEEEIVEYYGDYTVNPLIVSREDDAAAALSYHWNPELIHGIRHTVEWFNNNKEETMNITQIFALIEAHWFDLSVKEKAFLNYTFVHGGALDQALTDIINIRTRSGFTTHGHTAVDVSLYATGVASDLFVGHWRNDEIGQLLSRIMDCVDEQSEQTSLLQELFVNGTLKLCDPATRVWNTEWNNSVPYPWGNLLYPQNCVDAWE